ncbi:Na/Pi cotransporter family protein [Poseidonocella sp. HB161398]|uniref:Na/Pi cotransporter family protein n=1 Tax=Poseidonocella sp. HB161398 TaxID=2320855 RepID=UPI0011080942|nr:Na/Pi symporter [Poseidonocella sp. HB161398]
MKRYVLPAAMASMILAFWRVPDLQEIAAGVAVFLFGMFMLEDGFKLFGSGAMERVLAGATRSKLRALLSGFVTTSLLQSSSLVSVITISFLSAGLITLAGGVGIIFGANIGTTTGAWLVAGLGLKVDIAAYAMPMLALSILLVFQSSKPLRGAGLALGGLGFLFLGIHFMKDGFDTFQNQFDLTRFALTGIAGLAVYAVIGAAATVAMQSSHATMVLILTALTSGQLTYENALALAIGTNVGTTVTAILAALGANVQGRRLALAHLVFNALTAVVALTFIAPLAGAVDRIAAALGIAADDYTLKLAAFHTVFNLIGVALMLPLLDQLVAALERWLPDTLPETSRPLYLNEAVYDLPLTFETALRKEVRHLADNAVGLILRGLNLQEEEVFASQDLDSTVRTARTAILLDYDDAYERRVKSLHAAILDFSSHIGDREFAPEIADRVYELRDVAGDVVQAVKSVKHLRKNVQRYTTRSFGLTTELYDVLRAELARIAAEIHALSLADPEERSALWLDQERAQIEHDARATSARVDRLIRSDLLSAERATSFLNDSHYAYAAMRLLTNAARRCYMERDLAMAEVEKLISLDEDELPHPGEPDAAAAQRGAGE